MVNAQQDRKNAPTDSIEERKPYNVSRTDSRDDLLDVIQSSVLLVRLQLRVARVGDELLREENLADGVAPVTGRLDEDSTDGRGCAWVNLGVTIGKCDGAR